AATTATVTEGPASIQANFVLNTYQLSVTTDGTEGATTTPSNPQTVDHGVSINISATAPAGYSFVDWTVSEGTVNIEDPLSAATTATVTEGPASIQANFELLSYTITATAGANGSIDPQGVNEVPHGGSQSYTITPDEGYRIDDIWVNGLSAGTSETYLFENITQDQTIEVSFIKLIEIEQLSIPNAPMKIGDIIRATLRVSYDDNTPYSLVSGSIGGYALSNLQRVDFTTYTADFTINEGGNSYTAGASIPVSNLVLTDSDVVSEAFNGAIVQANDPVDAERPVITNIYVESGDKGVGETVRLIINSDGAGYSIDSTSRINGIPVSEPNITFTELGSGSYSLDYIVREGDNDVERGELTASVILVKPSGNTSVPYTSLLNTSQLSIDANSPVVTKMEVPDGEFVIGDTVEVVISADDEGYGPGSEMVINNIPISSSRVNLLEQGAGVYLLRYKVGIGDDGVESGGLQLAVYLEDAAGNTGGPFSNLEKNSLSVYTELPTASISGNSTICEGDSAQLKVFLTGRAPWSIFVSDGSETKLYEDIYSSPYTIYVSPLETTTYFIDLVSDVNNVVNNGTDFATVSINEKTDVEIINLSSGFNVEADPVLLEANVEGGTFSGPGVNSLTGYFDPGIADTVNSPHTLYYTFTNIYGCTSIDSALVFVLGAEGDVYIPDSLFCDNQDTFTVSASNTADATGSFRLLNSDSLEINGLSDKGDNTARVNPSLLDEGNYIIEYSYEDNLTFTLWENFRIEATETPEILIPDREVYCQNENEILLSSSLATAVFEGPGVREENGAYYFDPGVADAGKNIIKATNTSESGCSKSVSTTIRVNPVPSVMFDVDRLCVSSRDTVFFSNLTEDKFLFEEWYWDFDDPASGESSISTRVAPWHIFEVAGTREIMLRGTTEAGCVDSVIQELNFEDNPIVSFTWDNECFDNESIVNFSSDLNSISPVETYRWTVTDTAGESATITGSESLEYSFDEMSSYVIELEAETQNGCSGRFQKEILLKPVFSISDTESYFEDFASGEGWWTVDEDTSSEHISWDYRVVNFENMGDALSRTWYTNLPEESTYEHSWVMSPCFNFESSERPMIALDISQSLAKDIEGVVLQATVDGHNWKTIGAKEQGINWYNSSEIFPAPGGSTSGWTGKDPFEGDEGWVNARHDLDSLDGEKRVQFRMAFASEHNAAESAREGFAFNNVMIRERNKKALLEHFTNTSELNAAAADESVNAFYNDHFDDMVKLEYHTSFPGQDPFNDHNRSVPATRSLYSGVTAVPYALIDGGFLSSLRFDFDPDAPNAKNIKRTVLQDALFDIEVNPQYEGSRVNVEVEVTALADLEPEERIVHIVVFEKLITGVSTVNGSSDFLNVIKDMLPNSAGTAVFDGWIQGQTRTYNFSWDYRNVYDPEMLRIAAFVQNDINKEVYQVSTDDDTNLTTSIEKLDSQAPNINIYPNPAAEYLNVRVQNIYQRSYMIEFYDQLGRSVMRKEIRDYQDVVQIDIGSLKRGVYFVRVMDKENGVLLKIQKLMVMK
ncbi:MAG: T9SS type A sorting domain-containing protein, partial [bacterium]